MTSQRSLRVITLIVAAVLGLDGGALCAGGLWTHQFSLSMVGLSLLLSAGLVLLYGRWHRRQLAEIAAARHALRIEAGVLRDLAERS
ncbi:MAG TPA: hypothetical protein VFL95_02170 [Gemmatimonadales bacterium]|nr:hypothetical protein [Gemmatimonadales bacterium]